MEVLIFFALIVVGILLFETLLKKYLHPAYPRVGRGKKEKQNIEEDSFTQAYREHIIEPQNRRDKESEKNKKCLLCKFPQGIIIEAKLYERGDEGPGWRSKVYFHQKCKDQIQKQIKEKGKDSLPWGVIYDIGRVQEAIQETKNMEEKQKKRKKQHNNWEQLQKTF